MVTRPEADDVVKRATAFVRCWRAWRPVFWAPVEVETLEVSTFFYPGLRRLRTGILKSKEVCDGLERQKDESGTTENC